MDKKKILFVCIHNSARSQMAEELLRKIAGDRFEAESAGIEPGTINPYVAAVLKEEGIDITSKATQSVADLLSSGKTYDYVVTVCDEASAEKCPVFPGNHERLHWGFIDPSQFKGSDEEQINKVKEVKKEIEDKIVGWLESTWNAKRE